MFVASFFFRVPSEGWRPDRKREALSRRGGPGAVTALGTCNRPPVPDYSAAPSDNQRGRLRKRGPQDSPILSAMDNSLPLRRSPSASYWRLPHRERQTPLPTCTTSRCWQWPGCWPWPPSPTWPSALWRSVITLRPPTRNWPPTGHRRQPPTLQLSPDFSPIPAG